MLYFCHKRKMRPCDSINVKNILQFCDNNFMVSFLWDIYYIDKYDIE